MINYWTVKETADSWHVSPTWVTMLCKKGRVYGAQKIKNKWMIPQNSNKPQDRRTKEWNDHGTDKFSFIDLFAGIGGFHQAMRSLGGTCVMASEINQACVETYKLNFTTQEGDVRGDINKVDPYSIAAFDVLCAGFPCQSFSKAGYQLGFKDPKRGNLFYAIMGILDAHPETQFIVLENVRNLADKKDHWAIIKEELSKRNFIITKDPLILSPSNFGIPQVRERVYILGIKKSFCIESIQEKGLVKQLTMHR